MYMGQFGSKSDPSSILPGTSTGFRIGSRSTRQGYGAGATRQASLYPGSACPAGQEVVQHVSTPISPKYIGGPRTEASVYCKPIPIAGPAPAPPPPQITVQTTVSPTMQTEISPQISPVFAQMQDSPGAAQTGAPTQYQPGGMTAEGGGTSGGDGAMLEYLRMQSEQEAQRRREETAQRERERQERVAREASELQYQRERQAHADALQLQQLEMQRLDNERRAAEQAGRDQEAAALQAQYEQQRREWEQTSATPPQLVQTGSMPGAPGAPGAPMLLPVEAGPGLPMPLIVALGAAVLVGGYFYATKGKKVKR